MKKENSCVDICGQEILIGRVVAFATKGTLSFGVVERFTEKKVVFSNGAMRDKKDVFMMDKKWKLTSG